MNAPPYPEGRWSGPLGEPPGWLLDLAAPPPRQAAPSVPSGRAIASGVRLDCYVEAALRGELERVETARPGIRHHALFVASCALGSLIGARLLNFDLARDGFIIAAELCGLVNDEGLRAVEGIIASGFARGLARPRGARS
jgi:hypothetical protein